VSGGLSKKAVTQQLVSKNEKLLDNKKLEKNFSKQFVFWNYV
jgi:hypothetical protein